MASSNDLTSNNPAATFAQLLHIGTGSASAAQIRTGTGIATAMELVTGGFKINGTFNATGNTTVGGTLSVTGNATMTGSLTLAGVLVRPSTYQLITEDVTSSLTTGVAISTFDFTPVSGATYELEMAIIATSAATTTGVHIVNTSGTGTLLLVDHGSNDAISGTGGTYSPAGAPSSVTPFGILLKGYFAATSTAPLTWRLKSEVGGSSVAIKAGSILKITRIN